jgi:uncharacterized protein YndB with AHSA1/START domain
MELWEIAVGIAGFVALLVLALLLYASTRPNTFEVKRSLVMAAPPEKIFPLIDHFTAWPQWSPYEKLDAAMKKEFPGAAHGPGAMYAWEGNSKAGKGRMEITSTTPPTRMEMSLHFDKPMRCDNTVVFTLVPQGNTTDVTWAMLGKQMFIMKVVGVFMNMDKMIGKDFEVGLANLKAIAEK